MQGLVSFLIIPNMDFETTDKPKPTGSSMDLDALIHIRALFNYVPQEDIYIPCKEIGLGFNKGDILHIISQVGNRARFTSLFLNELIDFIWLKEDTDWWQAFKNEEKDQSLAGLIPSQSFQERRCSQMQAFIGDSFMNRKKRNFIDLNQFSNGI